jgi:hypothetical protein
MTEPEFFRLRRIGGHFHVPKKPVIYKFERYLHHGESPECRNCRQKKSSGVTVNGPLACVVCQDKVDTFINDNFDVRPQVEYMVEILKGEVGGE